MTAPTCYFDRLTAVGAKPLMTLEHDIAEYLQWVKVTFPRETPKEQFDHFIEELKELIGDLSNPGEYADVFMLLMCVARNNGVDLIQAFRDKFAINKARTWEKTERGYRHVK